MIGVSALILGILFIQQQRAEEQDTTGPIRIPRTTTSGYLYYYRTVEPTGRLPIRNGEEIVLKCNLHYYGGKKGMHDGDQGIDFRATLPIDLPIAANKTFDLSTTMPVTVFASKWGAPAYFEYIPAQNVSGKLEVISYKPYEELMAALSVEFMDKAGKKHAFQLDRVRFACRDHWKKTSKVVSNLEKPQQTLPAKEQLTQLLQGEWEMQNIFRQERAIWKELFHVSTGQKLWVNGFSFKRTSQYEPMRFELQENKLIYRDDHLKKDLVGYINEVGVNHLVIAWPHNDQYQQFHYVRHKDPE